MLASIIFSYVESKEVELMLASNIKTYHYLNHCESLRGYLMQILYSSAVMNVLSLITWYGNIDRYLIISS